MAQLRNDRTCIDYRLSFRAPFHVGTGLRRGLVHRAVARDPHGFLFVPGSSVKGVARERCEEIARLFDLAAREPHAEAADLSDFGLGLGVVEDVFGARTRPGTLFFEDAHLISEDRQMFECREAGTAVQGQYREYQVASRTRVQISRLTGAARSGHLFSSEYGLNGMSFDGTVRGVLPGMPLESAPDLSYQLVLLVAGLLAVEMLGGERSTGAGRCQFDIRQISMNGVACTKERIVESLDDLEYYDLARES